jgi:hypothetical protein
MLKRNNSSSPAILNQGLRLKLSHFNLNGVALNGTNREFINVVCTTSSFSPHFHFHFLSLFLQIRLEKQQNSNGSNLWF